MKNTFNSVNRLSLTETVLQRGKEMRNQSKNLHTWKIAREIGLQNFPRKPRLEGSVLLEFNLETNCFRIGFVC